MCSFGLGRISHVTRWLCFKCVCQCCELSIWISVFSRSRFGVRGEECTFEWALVLGLCRASVNIVVCANIVAICWVRIPATFLSSVISNAYCVFNCDLKLHHICG